MKIKMKLGRNDGTGKSNSIEITDLDTFELDKIRLLLTSIFQYTNVSDKERLQLISDLSTKSLIDELVNNQSIQHNE